VKGGGTYHFQISCLEDNGSRSLIKKEGAENVIGRRRDGRSMKKQNEGSEGEPNTNSYGWEKKVSASQGGGRRLKNSSFQCRISLEE